MRLLTLAVAVVVALGCQKAAVPASKSGGERVVDGTASDLRVTTDGQFAAFLVGGTKPHALGVPPQMRVGDLYVSTLAGQGTKRKLGAGVTNLPGGFLFSPDGKWVLFLTHFQAANQAGRLEVASLSGGAARVVGEQVTSLTLSKDSRRIAFVDSGVLKHTLLEGGEAQTVAGEVSTAQFTPDAHWLIFRRTLSAGGALLASNVDRKGTPTKLGEQVGDFSIAPGSDAIAFAARSIASPETYDLWIARFDSLKPVQLAIGTGTFAFSPDGKYLARTEGQRPEQLGDLFVGPASGGPGRKVGERVFEFSFSPNQSAIAYLERYDISARAGLMGVATLPDGKARRVGDRVPNYEWSADGTHLAFQSRFLKPVYSVDLMLYEAGAEKATKVAEGVFGYAFSPKGDALLLRTKCIREGRACDLHRLDLNKLGQPTERVLEGVYSFKMGQDASRVLFTYARTDADTYDVGVQNLKTRAFAVLDRGVQLPVFLAGADSSRVVYTIAQGPQAGLYVAQKLP